METTKPIPASARGRHSLVDDDGYIVGTSVFALTAAPEHEHPPSCAEESEGDDCNGQPAKHINSQPPGAIDITPNPLPNASGQNLTAITGSQGYDPRNAPFDWFTHTGNRPLDADMDITWTLENGRYYAYRLSTCQHDPHAKPQLVDMQHGKRDVAMAKWNLAYLKHQITGNEKTKWDDQVPFVRLPNQSLMPSETFTASAAAPAASQTGTTLSAIAPVVTLSTPAGSTFSPRDQHTASTAVGQIDDSTSNASIPGSDNHPIFQGHDNLPTGGQRTVSEAMTPIHLGSDGGNTRPQGSDTTKTAAMTQSNDRLSLGGSQHTKAGWNGLKPGDWDPRPLPYVSPYQPNHPFFPPQNTHVDYTNQGSRRKVEIDHIENSESEKSRTKSFLPANPANFLIVPSAPAVECSTPQKTSRPTVEQTNSDIYGPLMVSSLNYQPGFNEEATSNPESMQKTKEALPGEYRDPEMDTSHGLDEPVFYMRDGKLRASTPTEKDIAVFMSKASYPSQGQGEHPENRTPEFPVQESRWNGPWEFLRKQGQHIFQVFGPMADGKLNEQPLNTQSANRPLDTSVPAHGITAVPDMLAHYPYTSTYRPWPSDAPILHPLMAMAREPVVQHAHTSSSGLQPHENPATTSSMVMAPEAPQREPRTEPSKSRPVEGLIASTPTVTARSTSVNNPFPPSPHTYRSTHQPPPTLPPSNAESQPPIPTSASSTSSPPFDPNLPRSPTPSNAATIMNSEEGGPPDFLCEEQLLPTTADLDENPLSSFHE